jgi:hypothetical protein
MFNSCVNPFIYCFSNREYKRAFLSIWSTCTESCSRKKNSVDLPLPERSPYFMRSFSTAVGLLSATDTLGKSVRLKVVPAPSSVTTQERNDNKNIQYINRL